MSKIIPVILCGGTGSRLYPLSRNNYPKQFLRIHDNFSLLQNTINRFKDFTQIILVTNINYKNIIFHQLIELKMNIKFDIIMEPVNRNTSSAINLVCKLYPDTTLIFTPADHVFDNNLFIKIINEGIKYNFCLLGIKPSYAETGYGYIIENNGLVEEFIEKPELKIAEELLKKPNCYWNSGVFIFNSSYAMILFNKYTTNNNKLINELILNNEIEIDDNIKYIKINEKYKDCDNISIDKSIAENIKNEIIMLKFDGLWNDIGSFNSIYSLYNNKDQNIISINSKNVMTLSKKLILLNNIKDTTIIDTEDAIYVGDINKSQDVKLFQDLIKDKKEKDMNTIIYYEWGWIKNKLETSEYRIDEIKIMKKNSLEYETEYVTSLVVLNGIGYIENDIIEQSDTVTINKEKQLIIKNINDENLIILRTELMF